MAKRSQKNLDDNFYDKIDYGFGSKKNVLKAILEQDNMVQDDELEENGLLSQFGIF